MSVRCILPEQKEIEVTRDKLNFTLNLIGNGRIVTTITASYIGHDGFGNSTQMSPLVNFTEEELGHIARVLYRNKVVPPTAQLRAAIEVEMGKDLESRTKISEEQRAYFAFLGIAIPEGVKVKGRDNKKSN